MVGEKEGYRMENGVLKNYRPFEKMIWKTSTTEYF